MGRSIWRVWTDPHRCTATTRTTDLLRVAEHLAARLHTAVKQAFDARNEREHRSVELPIGTRVVLVCPPSCRYREQHAGVWVVDGPLTFTFDFYEHRIRREGSPPSPQAAADDITWAEPQQLRRAPPPP